jgi:uracil-DNA glycosylase
MTVTPSMIDDLMRRSEAVVRTLAGDPAVGGYINAGRPLPRPFMGTGEVKLVILGQDPTVERKESRESVTTVLNLDRGSSLRTFLHGTVCKGLGLKLEENVYATNVCKNFFTASPKDVNEPNLIAVSAPHWLPLLRHELAWFPKATVISLGEPVLSALVSDGFSQDVKAYWGYRHDWQPAGFESFRMVEVGEASIERPFFPFIHQWSQTQKFYTARIGECLAFIRSRMAGGETP